MLVRGTQYTSLRLSAVAVVAGLLLGVGSIFFTLWPLSLLSFAGVTYLLHNAPKRSLWRYLFLVGAATYGCTFYALYFSTLPLDWLGVTPGMGLLLITSVWMLTVVIFALSFTLGLRLVVGLVNRWWSVVLGAPSAYVLADALGTIFFSLVFVGPSSTIGVDFSMASPGYQLADSHWLRLGAWGGGLYGLLFVQAAFGVLGYCAWRSQLRWRWAGAWALVFVLVSSNVFAPATAVSNVGGATLKVGVVSTFEGSAISATAAEQLEYAILKIPKDTDVVALPEDTRFLQYLDETRVARLQDHFSNAYVIDSGSIPVGTVLRPEVQVYNTREEQLATSSKEFLMVFGEYLPWLYRGVGSVLGLSEVVNKLDDGHRYEITDPAPLFIGDIPVSVKLCSDAMSPRIYARDTNQGAGILFNLASHGWFHHSRVLHDTAVRVGQVRAVESGRWYVRAGHDTPSFIINARGQVVATQSWFVIEPLVIEVPVLTHRTPYSVVGVWVVLVPFFVLLALYLRSQRARIRQDS